MILLYHKIYPEAKTEWWVTPDAFYLQMLDLQNKKVVYLDDYNASDPDQCVITFDGVYENLWKYAIPILQHFGYPFELFIVGSMIGQGNEFDTVEPYAQFASRETLQKMVATGGRLQWHTWSHPVLVGQHTEEEYQRELIVPDEIRALDPDGFKWFAFPHGRRDESLIVQSQKYFKGALACDDGNDQNLYDLPRVTILEKTRFSSSTVSLIIPCYNYGHLAAEAIESALYQIYPLDEILFIDDASTDNSVEVAKRYEPQIRVVSNEKNLGVIENFRKAVELTTGDYICFLGADNRFRSDYVEKAKVILDTNPDVAIAYTHFVLFGQRAALEATRTNVPPHPTMKGFFLREFPAKPKEDVSLENYMHGSSMYRRQAYNDVDGYQKDVVAEDHSLFIRMLRKGWRSKLVDAYVLEYRQHSREQFNMVKVLEMENAHLRIRIKALDEENVVKHHQIQSLQSINQSLQSINQSLQSINQSLQSRLEAAIVLESGGLTFRLLSNYRTMRDKIFPPGSQGRRLYDLLVRTLSALLSDGPRGVWRRVRNRTSRNSE